ncbi:hypothetical protein G7046_g4233 [Stylonectria norvegica]|nr:hypothetical protein G7046_g4233 [Stylonectria norvegica]
MAGELSCVPLDGNSDLYGRGIRIGIYLQWVSSWILILVEPMSTQSVYEVNSTFVFAVVVATIIARDTMHPIETYLMLQIALGFYVTTLGTFGVRAQLLNPSRLQGITDKFRNSFERVIEAIKTCVAEYFRSLSSTSSTGQKLHEWMLIMLRHQAQPFTIISGAFQLPLDALSPLKPPEMAWSGVLWRTSIAGIIAGFNLNFWYQVYESSNKGTCGPPLIFVFSKQRLQGPVVTLYKVAAVITAIFIFPPSVALLVLSWQLLLFSCHLIHREIIGHANPKSYKNFQAIVQRINRNQEHISRVVDLRHLPDAQTVFLTWVFFPQFRTLYDILEFYGESKESRVTLSDVIKASIALFGGDTVMSDEAKGGSTTNTQVRLGKPSKRVYISCVIWNMLTLSSIIWFILSIELTLKWNNIRGVDTIGTTGQLLPFIVGCVSMSRVSKRVVLKGMQKLYPEWANTRWEGHLSADGVVKFKISKKENQTPLGGGEQEEGIIRMTTPPSGP